MLRFGRDSVTTTALRYSTRCTRKALHDARVPQRPACGPAARSNGRSCPTSCASSRSARAPTPTRQRHLGAALGCRYWVEWEIAIGGWIACAAGSTSARWTWITAPPSTVPPPRCAAARSSPAARAGPLLMRITDWLAAEDALDKVAPARSTGAGGLRSLDSAVKNLDVLTATLDGARTQLLGLPVRDGLHRPSAAGGREAARRRSRRHTCCWPAARDLLQPRVLRRLRLAAGTASAGGTITPTRRSIADRPGALLLRPRLRPARWLFASSMRRARGRRGLEARRPGGRLRCRSTR